jgi:hypothetical protein
MDDISVGRFHPIKILCFVINKNNYWVPSLMCNALIIKIPINQHCCQFSKFYWVFTSNSFLYRNVLFQTKPLFFVILFYSLYCMFLFHFKFIPKDFPNAR